MNSNLIVWCVFINRLDVLWVSLSRVVSTQVQCSSAIALLSHTTLKGRHTVTIIRLILDATTKITVMITTSTMTAMGAMASELQQKTWLV